MWNKYKNVTIKSQVKRDSSEYVKWFCCTAYCVKQHSMVLKLQWVIKNWFENFVHNSQNGLWIMICSLLIWTLYSNQDFFWGGGGVGRELVVCLDEHLRLPWLAPRWIFQKFAFMESSDMILRVNIINEKTSLDRAVGSGGHSEPPS